MMMFYWRDAMPGKMDLKIGKKGRKSTYHVVCLPAGCGFPINTSAFSVKFHVPRDVLWNHWISGWAYVPFSLIQRSLVRHCLPGTSLFCWCCWRSQSFRVCTMVRDKAVFLSWPCMWKLLIPWWLQHHREQRWLFNYQMAWANGKIVLA